MGAAYALLAGALWILGGWVRRRGALVPRAGGKSWGRRLVLAAFALTVLAVGWGAAPGGPSGGAAPRPGLRMDFLDVGQGDAILLRPADGGPVLVDGGPHGDGLRGKLSDRGVSELAAAAVTHDQSDHAGGIEDLLGQMPVRTLLYGDPSRSLLGAAASAGVRAQHVATGSEIRSGSLRVEVLWPPREAPSAADADPNLRALVLIARWHGFSALLTADAEAEAVQVQPGPVDVLKVAHHGSIDAGLDGLLDQAAPGLAVISVGAHNSYGHPTPETLATLARHRVPTLRTDRDGTIEVEVTGAGWSVRRG